MSSPRLVRSGMPPREMNVDSFDLVVHDGRQLLVGSHYYSQACTWDLATGAWAEYDLDDASLGETHTDLTAVAATVVAGRIVFAGGGDHQGFAMWDLESGAVRLSEQEGGVSSVTTIDLDGRTMFVNGESSATGLDLWDAASDEDLDDEDLNIWTEQLHSEAGAANAVAAGRLNGLPVLVANDYDARVTIWDVDGQHPVRTMAPYAFHDSGACDCDTGEFCANDYNGLRLFAITTVNGRVSLVGASRRLLAIGDPETGAWERTLTVPGREITCMDAKNVNGRCVAATGHHDGSVRLWDLDQLEPLGAPCREDEYWVRDVRITEVDDRAVVVSAADGVRIWEVPG